MDFDSNARLNNGQYTEGGGGVLPSFVTARWMNAVTRALRNVIVEAGAIPDIDAPNQVKDAISALVIEAVEGAIAELVGTAPTALDTLNELASALANDPNFATTMTTALAGKSNNGHGHAIGDVSGLQTALNGKSGTDHGHAIGGVSGLQSALNGKAPLVSPSFSGTVTAPTPASSANDTRVATTAFVRAVVSALVDSSPAALDTLNELAAALGDDPNFATTMTNALAGKVPTGRKVSAGPGLGGGGNLTANLTFSLLNLAAGSSSTGAVFYNGTTRSAGRFYGGSTNPVSSTRLNYDGYFNATRFYRRSSRRVKNIERVDKPEECLKRVLAIGKKGVSVGHYKSDKQHTNSRWLIAEDVAKISPEVIQYDERGRPASMDYGNLIGDLYAAVYQQQTIIERQQKLLDALEKKLGG